MRLPVQSSVSARPGKGHLEPIGCQSPPDGKVDEYIGVPGPADFHMIHVVGRRPAVFRKAALGFKATPTPSGAGWTDLRLGSGTFANLSVLTEVKIEDRSTEPRRVTVGDFMSRGGAGNSASRYIVSVMPEPMAAEVSGLPAVTCSSYKETLLETNMWLSSGATVSALHSDADNIVNCLLQGTKRWILVHPRHRSKMYMASRFYAADHDLLGYLQRSDISEVNTTAVNLTAHPAMATIPWQTATLQAGDCVYLPPGYIHQVSSPPGRNLAVSYMFASLFDTSSWRENGTCTRATHELEHKAAGAGVRVLPYRPLERKAAGAVENHERSASKGFAVVAGAGGDGQWHAEQSDSGWASYADLPFVWKYTGFGAVPMGYQSPSEVAASFQLLLRSSNASRLGGAGFVHSFVATGGGSAETAATVWALLMLSHTQSPIAASHDDCSFESTVGCQQLHHVGGWLRSGPWWDACKASNASIRSLRQRLSKQMAMLMDSPHGKLSATDAVHDGAGASASELDEAAQGAGQGDDEDAEEEEEWESMGILEHEEERESMGILEQEEERESMGILEQDDGSSGKFATALHLGRQQAEDANVQDDDHEEEEEEEGNDLWLRAKLRVAEATANPDRFARMLRGMHGTIASRLKGLCQGGESTYDHASSQALDDVAPAVDVPGTMRRELRMVGDSAEWHEVGAEGEREY